MAKIKSSFPKNRHGFLKKPNGFLNKRYGFGLWQAIMIILIISGLMMVVLKYSKIAAQHTADTYVRQQLELYLNSAIEMTLLDISLSPKTNCLTGYIPPSRTKNGVTYSGNIDITKYYLLNGVNEFASCSATIIGIQSEETHGMVMMEAEVNASINGTVVSRIVRRTLQRP